MAQYISKDALVAEIEKRVVFNKTLNAYSRADECNAILSFLDTLEVKEVDLDFAKEVDMWIKDNGDTNGFFNVEELAKYFFELGLKTQKGE